ncbi:MAG: YifB family Mg chelatase-like AAA ATPase [Actinomycetota bacterium]|nr:YifB family Mg chelatase-like AAA ATPase [Actinomycetota bacterium]
MPLARALSIALVGVVGHVIEVEADLAVGLPGLAIVGLPDASLSEARDRVRAAVVNSGQSWPARRITLGLSPATLPKHGSGFDLAIAAAILAAAGVAPATALHGNALVGELGLDGRVRPVRGVLPAALAAQRAGLTGIVVPAGNMREAALVPGLAVRGVSSLTALLGWMRGDAGEELPPAGSERDTSLAQPAPDLIDVVGQGYGRMAVEVAAAGGHHLLLLGPPGAGKTMLAERMPGVLPPLDLQAALEVTAVHSVAGVLPAGAPLVSRPPYQAPHHSASVAALVGGGSGLARPGALSLAHRGVLFLDEAPEFPGGVLDALRQPMERGEVVLARSGGVTRYPARVQLVLAANPCPCSSPLGDQACTCTANARRRYLGRLSGPLLDRIDLQVELLPIRLAALLTDAADLESSAAVRARVAAARAAAAERLAGTGWRTNSEVPGQVLRHRWRLARSVRRAADEALDQGHLSARGYDRVIRVAWTLADLGGRLTPDAGDVGEACQLRTAQAA